MARYNHWVKLVLGAALLAPVVAGGATACKPSEPEIPRANVKPGAMPEGGEWRGVYYNPTFGYLHLQTDGESANGRWRTAAGDKWGELFGKVEGDLLRYKWTEHRIGMFGPNAATSGQGYFKYVVPEGDNIDHELKGEWGLGEADAGYKWDAIKQRNMQPDPDSVRPDELQSTVTGGDWDSSGRSKQATGIDADENVPVPEEDKKDDDAGEDLE